MGCCGMWDVPLPCATQGWKAAKQQSPKCNSKSSIEPDAGLPHAPTTGNTVMILTLILRSSRQRAHEEFDIWSHIWRQFVIFGGNLKTYTEISGHPRILLPQCSTPLSLGVGDSHLAMRSTKRCSASGSPHKLPVSSQQGGQPKYPPTPPRLLKILPPLSPLRAQAVLTPPAPTLWVKSMSK